MKVPEQALLYLDKAAEDEVLVDEVISSSRVSDAVIGFIANRRWKSSSKLSCLTWESDLERLTISGSCWTCWLIMVLLPRNIYGKLIIYLPLRWICGMGFCLGKGSSPWIVRKHVAWSGRCVLGLKGKLEYHIKK